MAAKNNIPTRDPATPAPAPSARVVVVRGGNVPVDPGLIARLKRGDTPSAAERHEGCRRVEVGQVVAESDFDPMVWKSMITNGIIDIPKPAPAPGTGEGLGEDGAGGDE